MNFIFSDQISHFTKWFLNVIIGINAKAATAIHIVERPIVERMGSKYFLLKIITLKMMMLNHPPSSWHLSISCWYLAWLMGLFIQSYIIVEIVERVGAIQTRRSSNHLSFIYSCINILAIFDCLLTYGAKSAIYCNTLKIHHRFSSWQIFCLKAIFSLSKIQNLG